jgi:hypothetical protein
MRRYWRRADFPGYKSNMRQALPTVLALVIASCAAKGPTGAPGPLDVQVVLAVGETAEVQGAARLRFQGVPADSRCPADAFCIQAGDATVRIEVLSAAPAATYDLHTGNVGTVTHAELTIALVQLAPYPYSTRAIRPEEYRATLRITR